MSGSFHLRASISLQVLEDAIDIRKEYIRALESGQRRLNFKQISEVAERLGVSPEARLPWCRQSIETSGGAEASQKE